ncbi:hypothetical protein R1sor_004552 [Riccia sorocarpa]|uniref:Homoserine kinase n=1 Tax=Riccia sorocarpa TaxID=122646 RepID=A0ABD3HJ09_9MARC
MATSVATLPGLLSLANARASVKNSFLGCDVKVIAGISFVRPLLLTKKRAHPAQLQSILSERKSHRVKCQAVTTATPIPPLVQLTVAEPKPVLKFVKAFAPATVANLGPGYDFLGCAVEGMGDYVTAEVDENVEPGKVAIASITGDGSRLSLVPEKNCAGIAGQATMTLLGVQNVGVTLNLHKGLPLGSGLGSSAASAAAAAVAVNALFGSPLTKAQLVQAGLESEATVSGYHADNVAPSLMGGFVLIRSYDPLHLIPLEFPDGKQLYFVLVIPEFEAPTKEMRAVLSPEISMKAHVENCSQAAALVSAILRGDAKLLGSALGSDTIVEPKRGPLIPGMLSVKLISERHGAFGCTISGAGPTTVAITDSEEEGHRIGARMVEEFQADGKLKAAAHVQKLDREGARVVESRKL